MKGGSRSKRAVGLLKYISADLIKNSQGLKTLGKDLTKLAEQKKVQVEKSICNGRKLLAT
jgi:hypothetical protein